MYFLVNMSAKENYAQVFFIQRLQKSFFKLLHFAIKTCVFKSSRRSDLLNPVPACNDVTTIYSQHVWTAYQAVAVDDNSKARRVLLRLTRFIMTPRADFVQTFQHPSLCVSELFLDSVERFRINDVDDGHFIAQQLAAVTDVDRRFYTTILDTNFYIPSDTQLYDIIFITRPS